jgi:ABC-type branched-subunit amino acid transport system permease subunit
LRADFTSDLPGFSQALLGLLMVLAALFMKRGIVGVWTHWRESRTLRKQAKGDPS